MYTGFIKHNIIHTRNLKNITYIVVIGKNSYIIIFSLGYQTIDIIKFMFLGKVITYLCDSIVSE